MASAWVVHQALGNAVRFFPGIYSAPPPDVAGMHVLLVDFSFPLEVMHDLALHAKSVTIIDHHDTAIERLSAHMHEAGITARMSRDQSGCLLTWNYFFPNTPPPAILLDIDDHDRWIHALPHSLEINSALYPLIPIPDKRGHLDLTGWTSAMSPEGYPEILASGIAIRKIFLDELAIEAGKEPEWGIFGGHVVPMHQAPAAFSTDLGNLIAKDYPFSVVYQIYDDRVKFALRSIQGGIHVNKIAEALGGGGHPHAAGISMDHKSYKIFMESMRIELSRRSEEIDSLTSLWRKNHSTPA